MSLPSSPSSASHSSTDCHLSPPTPDSYFSPAPLVVSPAELNSDTCFLSGDDMNKLRVFLRNKGRWGNTCNQLESSPPVDAPPCDDFSWEATQSTLTAPDQLPDPSRYSLLIHEVSLLVGLTDDDCPSPDDPCPIVSDPSHAVLPLTPTKSLASRKHSSPCIQHPNPPPIPIPTEDAILNLAVGSRDPAVPIPRYKNADAERPSPRKRHGQVFQFDQLPPHVPRQSPLDLDQTFCYPRAPPPKPAPTPLANRCSSLDRLECSLLKLEAHAPRDYRKSRSEGRSSDHVPRREGKRPSLPPPRQLKQQKSSSEVVPRHSSRTPSTRHFSGPVPPVPRPMLPLQFVVRSAVPLDDDLIEDVTPGSFMDMDIPHMDDSRQRRTSFRQLKNKEKMKCLVGAAKRVSRGVIAWGRSLTGSTKPVLTAQETSAGRL